MIESAGGILKRGRALKARRQITLAAIGLMVLTVVCAIAAQDTVPATGCADVPWPALAPNDAAYADAAELARVLTDHGFIITCIAPSKMTGMFDGQEGAALYRTRQGSFEALFLPKPQNFDRLQIVERHEKGRYLYSFGGRPRPWPANLIDGSHAVYVIKHVNQLIVADDKALAAHLGTTLAGR